MRRGLIMVVSTITSAIIAHFEARDRVKALDKTDGFGEFAPFYDHGAEGAIDMAGYKLATYQSADGPRAGLVVDDKVFDAAKLTKQAGLCDRARHPAGLEDRAGVLEQGRRQAGQGRSSRPLGRTKLLAPVLWPSAIFCAGANYADHAAEMKRRNGQAAADPDPHTLGLNPGISSRPRARSPIPAQP